jgi:hypothetical protein
VSSESSRRWLVRKDGARSWEASGRVVMVLSGLFASRPCSRTLTCQVTKEDYASMHGVTPDGSIFSLGSKKRRRDQLDPGSDKRSVKSRRS